MQLTRNSRYGAIVGAIAALVAVHLPPQPAQALFEEDIVAPSRRDFLLCGRELQQAGISAEVAAEQCGAALYPRDVAYCVSQINRKTGIVSTDALLTCRRVRRPIELANCVVDINRFTEGAAPGAILENCRRSLLPNRFASCVTGLSRSTQVDPTRLMNECIDGRDRPFNFYPVFTSPLSPIPGPPPVLNPVEGVPPIQRTVN